MKILVIGGSGQLGYYLMKELTPTHTVIGTSTKDDKELIKLDITCKNDVSYVFRKYMPDVVINTSAKTNVDECENSIKETMDVNLVGQSNILEEAENKKTKVVFISTYYVFDGNKKISRYKEQDKKHALNIYGITKDLAEEKTIPSKNHLIIRSSKIYSYGYDIKNLLARVVDALNHNMPFITTNDQYTNPISAEDVAKAISLLLANNSKGTFHVAGPDNMSNYEFAVRISKFLKGNSNLIVGKPTTEFSARAKRPGNCSLCIDKLLKEIEFKPNNIEKYLIKHVDKL